MARKHRVLEEEELVIVEIDGDILVWEGGELSGPTDLVENAHWASDSQLPQALGPGGKSLVSNLHLLNRPEQAAAAMVAARPLRAQIVKAPERVWNWVPALESALV